MRVCVCVCVCGCKWVCNEDDMKNGGGYLASTGKKRVESSSDFAEDF